MLMVYEVEWIKSYLSGRIQWVVMGDIVSEWKGIPSGVSQGSVLGPLLFASMIYRMGWRMFLKCMQATVK